MTSSVSGDSAGTPNLPTKIIPTKIAWLKHSRKSPMGMRIPPLMFKIMLKSKPLTSRILVRRLAVSLAKRENERKATVCMKRAAMIASVTLVALKLTQRGQSYLPWHWEETLSGSRRLGNPGTIRTRKSQTIVCVELTQRQHMYEALARSATFDPRRSRLAPLLALLAPLLALRSLSLSLAIWGLQSWIIEEPTNTSA